MCSTTIISTVWFWRRHTSASRRGRNFHWLNWGISDFFWRPEKWSGHARMNAIFFFFWCNWSFKGLIRNEAFLSGTSWSKKVNWKNLVLMSKNRQKKSLQSHSCLFPKVRFTFFHKIKFFAHWTFSYEVAHSVERWQRNDSGIDRGNNEVTRQRLQESGILTTNDMQRMRRG